MDEQIVRAAAAVGQDPDNAAKLRSLIDKLEKKEKMGWLPLIDQRAQSNGDVKQYVQALFTAFSSDDEESVKKRFEVVRRILILMHTGNLTDKKASDTINFLIGELDTFPLEYIMEIFEQIFDNLQKPQGKVYNSKPLELLPRCFEVLSRIEDEGSTKSAGEREDLFSRLFEQDWAPDAVSPLIAALKEIMIPSEQLERFVQKIFKELKKVDLQSLPSAVYNLLLLSTKGQQTAILKGILEHVEYREDNVSPKAGIRETSLRQLHEVEGTLLLSIDFAVKQDQALGTQVLKLLSGPHRWSAFNLAVLLTMSRIQRFEDKVFAVLKSSVSTFFKAQSRDFSGAESAFAALSENQKSVDRALVEIAKSNGGDQGGWDGVMQPLVHFGLTLMDTSTKFGESSSVNAILLGHEILLNAFVKNQLVRGEVVEQILSRIITSSDNGLYFAEFLKNLCQDARQILLEFVSKIKEALDHLSHIQPQVAEKFLEAIQPVLSLNSGLQDHVVLVLRKAMFNREVESRSTAVTGFIVILKSLNFQRSQDANRVGYEILNFLKRCLSQQAPIREKLYGLLVEVLRVQNSLQEPIFDLLHSQLSKYYESDEKASPVVDIEKCIEKTSDGVKVIEPLHALINCVQRCIRCVNDKDEDILSQSAGNNFSAATRKMLESIVKRILETDLSDFELSDTVDYSSDTTQGLYNYETACILLGIYEAILEFGVTSTSLSESAGGISKIFGLIKDLSSMVDASKGGKPKKEGKAKPKKGEVDEGDENEEEEKEAPKKPAISRKKAASGRKERVSDLSLECCFKIIKAAADEDSDARELLKQKAFEKFIIQNVERALKELLKKNKKVEVKELANYCRTFIGYFAEHPGNDDENKETFQSLRMLFQCVEHITMHVCTTRKSEEIGKFSELAYHRNPGSNSQDGENYRKQVNEAVDTLEDIMLDVLPRFNSEHFGITDAVATVCSYLANIIPEEMYKGHVKRLKEICSHPIENQPFTKALVGLLLKFAPSNPEDDDNDVRVTLAEDLVHHFGLLDEESVSTHTPVFGCVNEKTAPALVSVLLQSVDKIFTECEWILTSLHAIAKESDDEDSEAGKVKNILYRKLSRAIVILDMCSISKLPSVGGVALLKSLTRAYKTLFATTKDLIDDRGVVPSLFERIVDFSGADLSPHVASFIDHFQVAGKEATKAKISRESRTVPNLIFYQEKYETTLIKLSKQSKVPLMKKFKISASRDFKISEVAKKTMEDADVPKKKVAPKKPKKEKEDSATKPKKKKETDENSKKKKENGPKKKKQKKDEEDRQEESLQKKKKQKTSK
eukprot:TRINITY_DN7943_c0_g1_i1.p1 TRINITY_DN7943_c0_g1~~TRINITY_DN7943_c0_g1_i1.p1  ORF type:complete len:1311 (-),score=418.94 TRINITY_DN7943_c0_g1_i1:270-4202(-)